MKQDRSEAGKREIKSARTVLIKAMISSFYQYHSGCVFYCRRIARKAEAGRGGILSSINISATCPAMWRLTFSGDGHLVRLSANGCQPHRPNTALLFCAAGYHPRLLRTFHEHDLNFYFLSFRISSPSSFALSIIPSNAPYWYRFITKIPIGTAMIMPDIP